MMPEDVLSDVIHRVAAVGGEGVVLTSDELEDWPSEVVEALKSQGLLSKARRASSAVCPDCERECAMPVCVLPGTPHDAPAPFIVCDKRSDINRVPVPISRLERWRVSTDSIAAFLALHLGLAKQ